MCDGRASLFFCSLPRSPMHTLSLLQSALRRAAVSLTGAFRFSCPPLARLLPRFDRASAPSHPPPPPSPTARPRSAPSTPRTTSSPLRDASRAAPSAASPSKGPPPPRAAPASAPEAMVADTAPKPIFRKDYAPLPYSVEKAREGGGVVLGERGEREGACAFFPFFRPSAAWPSSLTPFPLPPPQVDLDFNLNEDATTVTSTLSVTPAYTGTPPALTLDGERERERGKRAASPRLSSLLTKHPPPHTHPTQAAKTSPSSPSPSTAPPTPTPTSRPGAPS